MLSNLTTRASDRELVSYYDIVANLRFTLRVAAIAGACWLVMSLLLTAPRWSLGWWAAHGLGAAVTLPALAVSALLRWLVANDAMRPLLPEKPYLVEIESVSDEVYQAAKAHWFGPAQDARHAAAKALAQHFDTEETTWAVVAVKTGPQLYGEVHPHVCRQAKMHRTDVRRRLGGALTCRFCDT